MLIHLDKPATDTQLQQAMEDLDGYIKFVVDVESRSMTIGGKRHFDGEQLLLKSGCEQKNLWGGGYDTESGLLDYDSIINIRPKDNNPSKEVIDPDIRGKIGTILKEKTRWKI